MTIQRLAHKEDLYKNFRRNMLGHCIDAIYYSRNDHVDNRNEVHNAFDYGFLSAIEKIRYEIHLLKSRYESGELGIESYFDQVEKLMHERLEITYGKNQDPKRGCQIEKNIKQNEVRISDDL